jgi:hypothetical protein
MSLLTLALIVAATNSAPNNNGTTPKTNASKTTLKASKNAKGNPANPPQDPNAPAPADGTVAADATTPKKGKAKKEEAPAADAGDPAALVANSVDAATQIANAAAKAAMDEVAKLSAIGGGATGPALVDGKAVEAGVAGASAVAKEVSKAGKARKEAPADSAEQPKPEKKGKPTKTAPTEGNDGELFGVKVEGKPEKK